MAQLSQVVATGLCGTRKIPMKLHKIASTMGNQFPVRRFFAQGHQIAHRDVGTLDAQMSHAQKSIAAKQNGLLVVPHLSTEALTLLADKTSGVLAIRVPNFIPEATCKRLTAWISNHAARTTYHHEIYDAAGEKILLDVGVDRVGTPFNSTYGYRRGDEAVMKYYDDVIPFRESLTAACHPDQNLMQKVMSTLDRAWPSGAEVAQFEGKSMNAGIIRITNPTKKMEVPHVDVLPSTFKKLETQLSCNVFLAAPPVGGELEVMRTRVRSFEEISSLPDDFEWSKIDDVDRSLEPLRIQPKAGDMVLINTRRPHSVHSFPKNSGVRMSIATFMGLEHLSDKLQCWS